jgi:hypothetical protein
MIRTLLIAGVALSLAGSALAQSSDYPPCKTKDQDHCTVTKSMGKHHMKAHKKAMKEEKKADDAAKPADKK